MTVPRFYLELPADNRETAILEGEEHHHASRVLRLRTGEEAILLDGKGSGFRAEVISINGRQTVLRLKERLPREEEEAPRTVLFQCLPSYPKMDEVIKRNVELGVSAIHPVVSKRSRGVPGPERLVRWRRIAREASRVAGRAYLPAVGEPLSWEEAVAALRYKEGRALALYADEEGGELVSRLLRGRKPEEVRILVGPEGGLAEEERASLRGAGVQPVSLGKHVLRAESAGAVLLAALRATLGSL